MQEAYDESFIKEKIEILKKYIPDLESYLNSGATEEELNCLESLISLRLPESFRTLYKLYNGEKSENFGFMFGFKWLSLDDIVREYQLNKEANYDENNCFSNNIISYEYGVIKEKYFHMGWIPFASDSGGNYFGLDLDPGCNGRWGQIINFGRDEHSMFAIQPNFESLISMLVDEFKSGDCRFILCRNEELNLNEGDDEEFEEYDREYTHVSYGGGGHFFDNLKQIYHDKNREIHHKIRELFENSNGILNETWKKFFNIDHTSTIEQYRDIFSCRHFNARAADTLPPMQYFVDLRELILSSAKIKELSFLSNLHLLKKLYIGNTGVKDISPISTLANLNELSMEGLKIEDLSPLIKCKNLRNLNINGLQSPDIETVGQIKNLRELNMSGIKVHSLFFLKNLTHLQSIHFDDPEDDCYDVFTELKELKSVTCSYLSFVKLRNLLGKKVDYSISGNITADQRSDFYNTRN